jgi:hypothetical protein
MVADLALRLVSCEVPEADAGHVLVMQKDIPSLHGRRYGIRTMEARLRSARLLPTRRTDQEEVAVAGADWGVRIEEDGADEPTEAMDTDKYLELDDDDGHTE